MAQVSEVISGIIDNQINVINKIKSHNAALNIMSGVINSMSGDVNEFGDNFYDKNSINTLLSNKASIVVGDLPSSGEANTLYINNDGKVAAKIGNELTDISLEAVDSLAPYKNDDSVVPTAKAVANYIDGKLDSSSELDELSAVISADIQNLVNNYWTKYETAQAIANIQTMDIVVLQELPPSAEAQEYTIYLIPSQDQTKGNVYDEYLVINHNYEKIGSTAIDLSQYYTKSESESKFVSISGLSNTLSSYALLNSPDFSGIPTAPTPTSTDNSTKIATTAFTKTAISNHNDSMGAHTSGFSHNLIINTSTTPSLILRHAQSDTTVPDFHIHSGSEFTFFLMSPKGTTSWLNTDGFRISTSTGYVYARNATLSTPTITSPTITSPTISGQFISINNNVALRRDYDITETPSANIDDYYFIVKDTNGKNVGRIMTSRNADGSIVMRFGLFNNLRNSNNFVSIGAGVDVNGNAVTSAPTPSTDDNSTRIATTAFVKAAIAAAFAAKGL